MRLDRTLLHLVHPECLSEDVVAVFYGVLNSRIGVISTSGDVMNDVLLSIVNFERVRFVVDHRRAINHCVSLIENRREHLVADVNQCARMCRNLWSLCGHDRNTVADMADFVIKTHLIMWMRIRP